jgi:DNA-directed RNA polymerase specialized sigma24 family protein
MSREMTDEQLLALSIRDGDAFGAFYERHARCLLAYAARRLGSADLGAEVTAETFAAALEGARRFRPEKAWATAWLYGIARNQIFRPLERGSVERCYRMRLGIAAVALDEDELARIEDSCGA